MVELNAWIIPVAALIPLAMGFIWYNPKVLGTAWMNAAGMTEEKMQGANMAVIFILTYIFACMLSFFLITLTIHQMGMQSLVMGAAEDSEIMVTAKKLMGLTINNYRTFGHGALHGVIGAIFFAFPVLATNALFERKSWKYILINIGYWIISLGLMGGVVCHYA